MARHLKARRIIVYGLGLLLAACAPPPRVAVEERKTVNERLETEKIGGNHIRIAEPGDTLYGIAFANGLDVNKLAAWNGLSDTSKLKLGQRIRLTRPLNFVDQKIPQKLVVTKRTVPPAQATSETHSSVRVAANLPPFSPADSQASKLTQNNKLKWHWPTSGKVVTRFVKGSVLQGIDIEGKLGQPVLAAGSGEVVYVGNALKGYGNLVIIKHNAEFLSAYANNQEIFVAEGQQLAATAHIASLGRNKQQRDTLHFQIRKHGKPVNPLTYLPNY